MTFQLAFNIFIFFITLWMGVIWSTSNALNVFMKIVFILCSFSSLFLVLQSMGYLVHV